MLPLLNWNQTEPRAVFVLRGAMTKRLTTPHQIVDHKPTAWAQGLLCVRVSLWSTFTNTPLSGLAFLETQAYAKTLIYFVFPCVFVCILPLCIPKVAWCTQPLNYPVPARNTNKHSVAQHEQRNFYISLRSAKAENRWFLTTAWLADLSIAPRLCGQLSTTETTPQPGCVSLRGSGFIVLSPSAALLRESCFRDCCTAGLCSWPEDRRLEAAHLCKAWVPCRRSDYAVLIPPAPFFLLPCFLGKKWGKVCGRKVFADLVQGTVTNDSWRSMTRHVNLS